MKKALVFLTVVLLALPALAREVGMEIQASDGSHKILMYLEPCKDPEVLAHIPPEFRDMSFESEVVLLKPMDAEIPASCAVLIPQNGTVVIQFANGMGIPIPVDFSGQPERPGSPAPSGQ